MRMLGGRRAGPRRPGRTTPTPKPAAPTSTPIDPVAVNGEIFVGWPKPDVALLFSGEHDGYLEPCGCAGLQNQKGGLKRRHTLIKELAAKGWPVVPLDLGGLTKRYGIQAELKFDHTLKALGELGYQAVGSRPERSAARYPEPGAQLERSQGPARFGERRHSRFRSRVQPAIQSDRSGRDENRRHRRAGQEGDRRPQKCRRPVARRSRRRTAQSRARAGEGRLRPVGAALVRRSGRDESARPANSRSSILSSPRAGPKSRPKNRR